MRRLQCGQFPAHRTAEACRTPGFGQNIALATTGLHLNLTQIVDAWGNEKRNFLNGVYPSVSGTGSPDAVSHYTQMIWQDTSEVGCGKANASGYEILVCDYSPQGNIDGTMVYSPKPPQTIAVSDSNLYKSFRTDYSGMPTRNVLINSVLNRPVACYPPSPVWSRRELQGKWLSGNRKQAERGKRAGRSSRQERSCIGPIKGHFVNIYLL